MSINVPDINSKANIIFSTLDLLKIKIENIEQKIKDINGVYMKYEFNRNLNLNQPNSYLKFQVDLLKNEKKYYFNIKNIFIKKFVKELFDISEYVILILISMEDLDIEHVDEKNNIMKKILKLKREKNIDIPKIYELINITMNNLKLTNQFINLFEKFILSKENNDKINNIHSNNLSNNLMNKKNHYALEYKKYSDQLVILINYFNSFSTNITKQFDKQEILKFFINTYND